MMHSGDEWYGDEITSGPNLEDLHGQDWNEAGGYARELTGQPGEPPEGDAPEDGEQTPSPEEDTPL